MEFIVYTLSALITVIGLVTITWEDRFQWNWNGVLAGLFITLCPFINTLATVVLICGAVTVLVVGISEQDFMNKPIFKRNIRK